MDVKDFFEWVDGVLYHKKWVKKNGAVSQRRKVNMFKPNLNTGYVQVMVRGKRLSVHRVVWEYFNGPIPEGMQVDHKNGIKHDNRLENLRLVTPRQNAQNTKQHRSGRLPGCSFHKGHSKWSSRVTVDGRTRHLGYYDTEQEAYEIYKKHIDGWEKTTP